MGSFNLINLEEFELECSTDALLDLLTLPPLAPACKRDCLLSLFLLVLVSSPFSSFLGRRRLNLWLIPLLWTIMVGFAFLLGSSKKLCPFLSSTTFRITIVWFTIHVLLRVRGTPLRIMSKSKQLILYELTLHRSFFWMLWVRGRNKQHAFLQLLTMFTFDSVLSFRFVAKYITSIL